MNFRLCIGILVAGLTLWGCGSDNQTTSGPVNPTGRLYVLNQGDGTLFIYDTDSLKRIDSIDAVINSPHYIDFSPDGMFYYLISLESPGTIAKFNASNNMFVDSAKLGSNVFSSAIVITSDNTFGYVCDFTPSSVSGHLHKYNLNTMTFVDSLIATGATSHDLKIASDGSVIAVCNRNTDDITLVYPPADTAFFVPMDSLNIRPTPPVHGPFGIAIDHNDSLAFVACIISRQIKIVDLKSRTVIDSIMIPVVPDPVFVPSGPTLMAVSPDNKIIYVTNQFGNSVVAADISTRQVIADISLGVPRPFGITMSDDGSRVYVACINSLGGLSGRIYVIDGTNQTLIDSLTDVGTNTFGLIWKAK